MTSHPCEEALALYSTGDLDAGEMRSIAEHVSHCAECRDCLAQFAQLEGMLARTAGEPSAEELLEVRQRVMSGLEGPRKRRGGVRWAAAAAVAAAAVLAVLWPYKQHPGAEIAPAPARIAKVRHAPVAPLSSDSARAVPVVRRKQQFRAPGLRTIALVARSGEEPLIKITTSDPKVVILLPPDIQKDERTETNE